MNAVEVRKGVSVTYPVFSNNVIVPDSKEAQPYAGDAQHVEDGVQELAAHVMAATAGTIHKHCLTICSQDLTIMLRAVNTHFNRSCTKLKEGVEWEGIGRVYRISSIMYKILHDHHNIKHFSWMF